ncbi:MAG: fluoride efflux transporter CrcB [Deltaproteobacteria bacterium]|nr:fluoride efflux transporter CrcB [Deltaproteobacteria bacterium]|tara:strand:- start:489 stop:878 length:390 start_codon:yes stop_codon:yes gene_type:complete
MKTWLAVALGGALGASCRYAVTLVCIAWCGKSLAPLATLTVNIVGSFLMGYLYARGLTEEGLSEELRGFLAIGFLGALTTFSAFSLDAMHLLEHEGGLKAALYVLASLLGALLAFAAGNHWTRQLLEGG